MVEQRLSSSERFRQKYTVDFAEVEIVTAGAPGELTLHTVPTDNTCRVMELTITHDGTEDTVITLLLGVAVKVRIPVPAQSVRVWSGALGRVFSSEEVVKVQGSSVVGGTTFISGSGLETSGAV